MTPGEVTLAAALRKQFPERSWNDVRALCASGKITIDGETALDPASRLRTGQTIAWDLNRRDARRVALAPGFRIVHEDVHLIIVEKPEGVPTVPFEKKDSGTLLDLIRKAWRAEGRRATSTPLFPVHRLDKDTSGLVCFAKTKGAERGLHQLFKRHLTSRAYIAIAHGDVSPGRIESVLVADRGDGLRGSTRRGRAHQGPGALEEGQRAVTHVEVIERLPRATVVRVRLETGRTHQIRIHLAERGHPLVGETVYVRDFKDSGGTLLPSRRLLLHAMVLGLDHPMTEARLDLESPPPETFTAAWDRLRTSSPSRS